MDDREFFDLLYQMWTKTTHAEDRYWDYQVYGDTFDINAVGPDPDNPVNVAALFSDADADWITAVHGCFPDLYRRLHEALDEADRLDSEMDEVQQQLMAAEMRVDELTQIVANLSKEPPWTSRVTG